MKDQDKDRDKDEGGDAPIVWPALTEEEKRKVREEVRGLVPGNPALARDWSEAVIELAEGRPQRFFHLPSTEISTLRACITGVKDWESRHRALGVTESFVPAAAWGKMG